MGKKTVAEFKAAFGAVKKPKLPRGISGKDKDALEDLDKKALNPGTESRTTYDDQFMQKAQQLSGKNDEYVAKLVAYKIDKHIESNDKLLSWLSKVPDTVRQAALEKLVPNDMSDTKTQAAMGKALEKGDEGRIAVLTKRDPRGTTTYLLDRIGTETDGGKRKALLARLPAGDPAIGSEILDKLTEIGDPGMTDSAVAYVVALANDKAALLAAAKRNPAYFAAEVLPKLKANNAFMTVMQDPDLRAQLQQDAPDEWDDLVESTPMLKVVRNVDARIRKDNLEDEPLGIAGAVFDAVCTNDGIELGYYTNRNDDDRTILTGGTDRDKEARENKRKLVEAQGKTMPDKPATQCHDLLKVLRTLMECYPDARFTITSEHIKGMLLTVPLNQIKSDGLAKKTFTGNVFDDGGTATNQILFTGNEQGQQSHTWLVINGEAFDPVLGTRGDAVLQAKANEFTWREVDVLAAGEGGWWIVKGNGTPQAEDNDMGFGSGYRLTKTPAQHLPGPLAEQLGLA